MSLRRGLIGLLAGVALLPACAQKAPPRAALTAPTVVEMTETVQRNQFGLITVQAEPRLDCAFSTEIRLEGGGTDRSADETPAGADGKARWSWLVHPRAVPGTYPLTVNCGGRSVTARYTVR